MIEILSLVLACLLVPITVMGKNAQFPIGTMPTARWPKLCAGMRKVYQHLSQDEGEGTSKHLLRRPTGKPVSAFRPDLITKPARVEIQK